MTKEDISSVCASSIIATLITREKLKKQQQLQPEVFKNLINYEKDERK